MKTICGKLKNYLYERDLDVGWFASLFRNDQLTEFNKNSAHNLLSYIGIIAGNQHTPDSQQEEGHDATMLMALAANNVATRIKTIRYSANKYRAINMFITFLFTRYFNGDIAFM